MAIERDIVAIPFIGGLDTKTDAKSVLPTKLVDLINGEFTEAGTMKKRPGYVQLGQVDGAIGLAARSDELLAATKTALHTYNEDKDAVQEVADFTCVTHTAKDIATTSGKSQTYPDMVTNGPATVVAWEQDDDIYFSVYNSSGETPYAVNQVAKTSSERPRVVAVGNYIHIYYANSAANTIFAKVINVIDLASIADAEVSIVTDLATNNYFDVVSDGERAHLLYDSDDSVEVGLGYRRINPLGSIEKALDSTTTPALSEYHATCGVAIAYHAGSVVMAVEVDEGAANATKIYRIDASSAVLSNSGSVDTDSLTLSGLAVGIHPVTGNGKLAVQVTVGTDFVKFYDIEFPGGTATITALSDGSVLRTKLHSSGFSDDINCYFLLGYISPTGLQYSSFLYRADNVLLGRLLYGSSPGELTLQHYPRPSLLTGNQYQMALQYRKTLKITDNKTSTSDQFDPFGVKRIIFDTTPVISSAQVGDTTYINGSQLWQYDGQNLTESGFHLFPDAVTSPDAVVTGTPAIPNGSYSYRCYYEWRKANGERERSAAIIRTINLTDDSISPPTAGNKRITVDIPVLEFTLKPDAYIVIYRTVADSTTGIYYRCSGLDPATTTGDNAWVPNSGSGGTVTFTDNMTDATLATKEWDYQNTGEVPNIQPDGPEFLGKAQGRLWMIGGGERYNNLRFSKLRSDGEPVAFSEVLEVTDAPERGGKTVAVSYVNNTPIVFKERLIYALAGDGPDNLGQNGQYVIQQISADMGCVDPGSVISYVGGLIFKSGKGIFRLGQDLSLTYIGADVEAYNTQRFVSATAVPDSNQIIFLTNDGSTLLYDYFYNAWSRFSNHEGIGSTVWGETDYVYLRSDGRIYKRDVNTWLDAGAPFALRARTAPLRLKNALQGFWKLRKLFLLGDWRSEHRLKVKVYYDREVGAFESFTFDPAEFIDTAAWGDWDTWGDFDYWGGTRDGQTYQFERKLKRQKCQTVSFEFYDTGANGPSYEVSELLLEVGLVPGPARLATARKI